MCIHQNSFQKVFKTLYRAFGPQHWWPAETPFEMMIGAILTQNTAWRNVEKAIVNLKASGAFFPATLLDLSDDVLAEWIRPAGFFRVKTRRIKAFLGYFVTRYGGEALQMRAQPASRLRWELLDVDGIGPETADCILLYALEKPSFVVDAYTRRIFGRLGLVDGTAEYHDVQRRFETALSSDLALFNEYHALIVALGKAFCRPTPKCEQCPLISICPVGLDFQKTVSYKERDDG